MERDTLWKQQKVTSRRSSGVVIPSNFELGKDQRGRLAPTMKHSFLKHLEMVQDQIEIKVANVEGKSTTHEQLTEWGEGLEAIEECLGQATFDIDCKVLTDERYGIPWDQKAHFVQHSSTDDKQTALQKVLKVLRAHGFEKFPLRPKVADVLGMGVHARCNANHRRARFYDHRR